MKLSEEVIVPVLFFFQQVGFLLPQDPPSLFQDALLLWKSGFLSLTKNSSG